jgi:hypothetical protein
MFKRLGMLVAMLALTATACGGSDSGDTATTAAAETTAAATEDQTATAQELDTTDEESAATTTTVAVQALGDGDESTTFYGNEPGTGTVEIGDVKYEFDLNILCLSMFGAMGVAGVATDGSAVDVSADFPPPGWEDSDEGWEPPLVDIDDEERDISWEAGSIVAEFYDGEGVGEITSFSADGRVAVGEANFVNTYSGFDNPTVESGRFEFVCPEG